MDSTDKSAISDDHVRRLRLRAQRLDLRSTESATDVARVVTDVCGIQAQDSAAAALAVRARGPGLTAVDVGRALVHERSLVRTWGMRGTLHLVAAADLCWLLPLLGPGFVRGDRRRRAELGLDEETCIRGIHLLRDALAHRDPLTRAELVDHLASEGIHLVGQAFPHLVFRAALEGVVCLGPDRGAKPTYVLLDEWIDRGPARSRDAALAEIAHRYLAAYGPARPEDLAAWSGLSVGDARYAWARIADRLIEVAVAGEPAWLLASRAGWLEESPSESPNVRLLARFDPYLLGYRRRELTVAPPYAKRVHPGGGILHPTLLVDGQARGTWRAERRQDRLNVIVEPFDDLTPAIRSGLEAEVADLARFLAVPATLSLSSNTTG